MRHYARADTVVFDTDEGMFTLNVTTEDGDEFTFNIHHLALDLAKHADETIGAWRREADNARTCVRPVRISEDDLDAYGPEDWPKRYTMTEAYNEQEMNR